VPDSLEPKNPPGAPGKADAGSPLVLIPVTAEDVARQARRKKAIWISAILAVALVSGWIYKRYSDPIHARQALDDARRLYDGARYDQAILSCDRAAGLKPDLTDAYLVRGRSHVALYDLDHAVADFSKAVELQPRDPRILLERASVYLEQKNYAAAIADSTAALALDPRLAQAYKLRGAALRASGDAQKAVAEFSHAIEIEPNSNSYFERGATYQILADHQHAVEDFTQAIAYNPDQPQTYYARAESERALGESKQAEEDHKHGRVLDGR
jgi:tetratricopeptide (TPR) repeat protein